MKVRDVTGVLDRWAPPALAAEWDNVGLLAGDANARVRRVRVCVDVTGAVLDEAIDARAELVIAHHPPIFKPLPAVTAQHSAIVHRAVRKGISLFAMHTNYDAAEGGTNDVLAEAAGLQNTRPIDAVDAGGSVKIVTFVPEADREPVARAAFKAGAGRIGAYDMCSFAMAGEGTFRPGEGANPTTGQVGRWEREPELRLEMVAPAGAVGAVCDAIRAAHSYETAAIDVYPLASQPGGTGHGRIGELARPIKPTTLASRVKKALGIEHVRGAWASDEPVAVAAVAAGAGRSVIRGALRAGAGVLITGEVGHHDALDAAEAGLSVVCLGHGNSEKPAMRRLAGRLAGELPELDVAYAAADDDPFRTV